MFLIGILSNIFLLSALSLGVRYDNYTLYRAVPITEKQLDFFKNLSDRMTVDFWRDVGSLKKPVEFIISPDLKKEFIENAKKNRIPVTELLRNVQTAIDKQTVGSYVRRNMNSFGWTTYYRLADIYEWLQDIAAEYPSIVKIQTIGNTEERRNIKAVRVIHKTADMKKERPKVIIEGGIHAREWISVSFVTYLLDRIIKAPASSDTELKEISLYYEWYFVPVLNPDGYEYTHTKDRFWRKNRGQDGFGVDLNRNFGEGFGLYGSQTKSAASYGGPSAFSERETITMRSYVNAQKKNLKYYLAFHSYGQAMIIPYTHLKEHKDNYDEVKAICESAAERIKEAYHSDYEIGNSYEATGILESGSSTDWVKKEYNVPYVLTWLLPNDGEYGLALTAEESRKVNEMSLLGVNIFLMPNLNDTRRTLNEIKKLREDDIIKIENDLCCASTIVAVGLNVYMMTAVSYKTIIWLNN